jgi:Holliday junction resolvase RusA-like endonuclease
VNEYLIRFETRYKPAPQGSKEPYGNGRVESSKGVKPFREAIGWNAKVALQRLPKPLLVQFPLQGPLVARMVFTVQRYTRGSARADAPYTRPDLSKYTRAAEDAVKDIIWGDDGQVVGYDLLMKTFPDHHPEALDQPGLVMAVRRATHEELGLDRDLLQGRKYTGLLEQWTAGQ